ncbi:MAG: hypothetical protein AAGB22_13470 [Bacteroidota bacterium]
MALRSENWWLLPLLIGMSGGFLRPVVRVMIEGFDAVLSNDDLRISAFIGIAVLMYLLPAFVSLFLHKYNRKLPTTYKRSLFICWLCGASIAVTVFTVEFFINRAADLVTALMAGGLFCSPCIVLGPLLALAFRKPVFRQAASDVLDAS